MESGLRVLAAFLVASTMAAGAAAAVAWTAPRISPVEVLVDEGGATVQLRIPVAMASFVLARVAGLPGTVCGSSSCGGIRCREAVQAVAGLLPGLPDAVLLEVRTPQEGVLIAKEGTRLRVEIRSGHR